MPVCIKHFQSYSRGQECPDCARNRLDRPYRGMNTPLLKVGGIRRNDVRGKRSWEDYADLKEQE